MIMPVGAKSFSEAMRMGSEIYHHLKVSFQVNNIVRNVHSCSSAAFLRSFKSFPL